MTWCDVHPAISATFYVTERGFYCVLDIPNVNYKRMLYLNCRLLEKINCVVRETLLNICVTDVKS